MGYETDLMEDLTICSGASSGKCLNRIGGLAISLYLKGSNLGMAYQFLWLYAVYIE